VYKVVLNYADDCRVSYRGMEARLAKKGNYTYCRIQIISSATRHRGYLTCQNMVIVTGPEEVLTKGLNRDNQPNMAILAQNWVFFQ